jgi:hypothetical protein
MLFARRGFRSIQYSGAYDHGVELGATDRLVAVAQLSDNPDKLSTLESRLARGNDASESVRCIRGWVHTGAGSVVASNNGDSGSPQARANLAVVPRALLTS